MVPIRVMENVESAIDRGRPVAPRVIREKRRQKFFIVERMDPAHQAPKLFGSDIGAGGLNLLFKGGRAISEQPDVLLFESHINFGFEIDFAQRLRLPRMISVEMVKLDQFARSQDQIR